jgi:transcriptional regulator with XRE-family HTH domain
MEELREYLRQFFEHTDLPKLQVEKRSGGKIKDSTIEDILSGKTKSISVEKLNALAEGLGVDAIELFKVASGKKAVFKHDDPWPSSILLGTMEKIVASPELTLIVKALVNAKPAKIKAVIKMINHD